MIVHRQPRRHPRRQARRHIGRAVARAAGAGLLAYGALIATSAAHPALATWLAILATLRFWQAARSAAVARRNRIGARSEELVAHNLELLRADGWTVKHAVEWPGRGDIDHVAVSPAGVAFAVETKTRRYAPDSIKRVCRQAVWLGSRRASSYGAVPVLALTAHRGVDAKLDGAHVASIERLPSALRRIECEIRVGRQGSRVDNLLRRRHGPVTPGVPRAQPATCRPNIRGGDQSGHGI